MKTTEAMYLSRIHENSIETAPVQEYEKNRGSGPF
jgi:hypothetical protein